eukprot:5325110-Prymnesium_polylepis.1
MDTQTGWFSWRWNLSGCKPLDLRGNSIGDAGAAALAEALKVNTALTSLDIRGNAIWEASAVASTGATGLATTRCQWLPVVA